MTTTRMTTQKKWLHLSILWPPAPSKQELRGKGRGDGQRQIKGPRRQSARPAPGGPKHTHTHLKDPGKSVGENFSERFSEHFSEKPLIFRWMCFPAETTHLQKTPVKRNTVRQDKEIHGPRKKNPR